MGGHWYIHTTSAVPALVYRRLKCRPLQWTNAPQTRPRLIGHSHPPLITEHRTQRRCTALPLRRAVQDQMSTQFRRCPRQLQWVNGRLTQRWRIELWRRHRLTGHRTQLLLTCEGPELLFCFRPRWIVLSLGFVWPASLV